jgi:hypothetical protein
MKKIEIRKTLFTRAAATGAAFIAIGSAGVMSLPAVAGAATTRPAVSQSTHKAETRIPPRRPSRIHPEILGPAISGEGGEGLVFINGGTGYTPGGLVFEGDWTGTAWAPGYQDVHANASGDIGSNVLNSGSNSGPLTLYGYDWATGTFTAGVPVFVHLIP